MLGHSKDGRPVERIAILAAIVFGTGVLAYYFIASPSDTANALAPNAAQAAKSTSGIAMGAVTGLPLPRFVSLKSDQVNVRRGAGTEHDVLWSYHRAGLPVEIIAEWDNWRRVRDADGADGWVFHRLLGARRTALVAPWAEEPTLPLRSSAESDADIVARLQPKVLAMVSVCDGNWCRISGEGFDGWMEQELLFGVYPGEQFD